MFIFGFLMNDNHKLKIKVKEQELTIAQLEQVITEKQTEINILSDDNKNKQQSITALEEKIKTSSLAAQETVERIIELSKIERDVQPNNQSSDSNEVGHPVVGGEHNQETTTENPAAVKPNQNTAGVVNEPSSKKFIDLRNNIYSHYK